MKDWQDCLRKEIFGVTSDEHGLIIPNPINILFHGVIDVMKAGTSDIYLLFEPDMYQYITEYKNDLSDVFIHIKNKLKLNLPEKVCCHVVGNTLHNYGSEPVVIFQEGKVDAVNPNHSVNLN